MRNASYRRSGRARRRTHFRLLVAAGGLVLAGLIIVLASWFAAQKEERDAQGQGLFITVDGAPDSALSLPPESTPSSGDSDDEAQSTGYTVGSAPETPAQLDDPLLVLVNSETPIPEDWEVTPRMVGEQVVDARMYDDYIAMHDAAGAEDIWIWIASGYRSVEDQERILEENIQQRMDEDGMTREEAEADALRTVNPPGYSEHHTGLAVDLNDVDDGFESTEAYAWLEEHAADYGFVQRYRSTKVAYTGIDNESWHYRYVGREHAQRMKALDMCLEEYVDYIRSGGT